MGFDDPSWSRWLVFLKALQALPLSPAELEIFTRHTGRSTAPIKPSRYAELVVGRRGGKSRILSIIACHLACVVDHRPHTVPGETPVVAIIARDRDQAKVIKNYISGFLRAVPLFEGMIEDEIADAIRLSNGVTVEIHTASIGSPRGRTFIAVLCDETAFWATGDSANPDIEVINAVRPGLSTIPYSLLLIASSPYAKRGILYQNFAKYFGVDNAPVLVWQGATQEMNSNLVDDSLIDEMYSEDRERAEAEFGAQFRSDIVQFITREAVESVLAHGVIELPPRSGLVHSAYTDPSGGSADSFTIAIAHIESNGLAVLDCVREVRPPFSPDAVVEEFAALLKSYGISRVTGDAYAGEWPRERFAVHGIQYDVSPKNKSQIYTEFLPALNGQRVRLLDLPRLTGQLCSLERRTARGGRDSIDHQPSAHDDVANAVAGVLTAIISDRRPALVRQSDMLTAAGVAPPVPRRAAHIAAVFWPGQDGTCATVWAAFAAPNLKPAMHLLDFELGPMRSGMFQAIERRTQELLFQCQCPNASVFVPDELRVQAEAAGLSVERIPREFNPEARLLSVGGHVANGLVQMCQPVVEKAQSTPFAGQLNFRGGEDTSNPLRAAAVLLIALGLDDYHPAPRAVR
jgi:hypothetical protein